MKSHRNTRTSCLAIQLLMALVLGLAVALPLPIPAHADPGDLDPTFGNNGKVVTVLGQRSEWANDMIVQADDKLLVIGASQDPDLALWYGFVLARYNADGTLDASFGDGGKVATVFGSESAYVEAIAMQADGKIVVAGRIGDNVIDDFLVARYNVDGSPDASFGTDGVVTTDFGHTNDSGTAVVIQSDGKIIVGGSTQSSDGDLDFALVRYSFDGVPDPTFGNQGIVTTDLGSDEYNMFIALQADGRIVGGGISGEDFVLVRYDSDGVPDPTFGSGGVATTDFGPWVGGIAIQPDGKIVMAGTAYTSTDDHRDYDLALARYNADGFSDGTFGEAGHVTTDFTGSDDYGSDVAIQADGRIVAAGRSKTSSGFDFALARYNADGTLDLAFGVAGTVTTDFAGGRDGSSAIAVQVAGKIVVAGWSDSALSESHAGDFALARYDSDGSPDVDFGVAGIVTSDFELGNSGASDVAVQVDGKTIVAGSIYSGRQTGWDFALVRYNLDGSVDQSFGTEGITITDIAGDDDRVGGLAIQTDGMIMVSGSAEADGGGNFTLVRYKPDGSLDSAFGNGGKVTTDLVQGREDGGTLTMQPDGKILMVGSTESGVYAVARYDPNGSLDSSFGVGGVVILDFGSTWVGSPDVLVQTDKKIVVTGTGGTSGADFALTRLNPDGLRDTSFGGGRTVTTDFGGWDRGEAVAVQSDGKIIMVGRTDNGGDFALACYNPDGSLNSGFGMGGIITTDFGSPSDLSEEWVYGLALQVDGKILVAGFTDAYDVMGDFALARYRPDGSLDQTFGTNGTLATDFGSNFDYSREWGSAIAIQAQGKILVAGEAMHTFTLVRYQGWGRVFATYLPVIVQGQCSTLVAAGRAGSEFYVNIGGSDAQAVAAGSSR
jgi:uncharacterized delta-60 repeat protein